MNKKAFILANWMIYAGLAILGFILLGGTVWLMNLGLLKVVGVLFLVGGLYAAVKGKLGWVPSIILIGIGLILVFNPYDLTRFFGANSTLTIGDVIRQ